MELARPEVESRELLRRLLRSGAVLYSGHGQQIVDRAGQHMKWILYSWGITLSYEGASLAADCLIDTLNRFESVQVAGVGMTGLPLVSSIVARGLGRYKGLYVRDEPEKWATRRQVEGAGDRKKPVVVVDDCICSGRSLRRAFAALEKDGYKVEGALCLVNFPWKGGTEWVAALGYRIETLFDVSKDLEICENLELPAHRSVGAAFDSVNKVPERLSPADAARWSAVHFLNSGLIPTPPESFDKSYDASGGVMVSFRDRLSDHRVARDGFYHLKPGESHLGRDIVLATAKTLLSSNGAVAQYGLDRLKIGVTLFGEQVPTLPRELDFDRFGLLIQSTVQPWKLAGALPNTQFFVSEIEQFRHARFTNARLFSHEPFTMFRHTVSKSIELGCTWPFFGVSANVDDGEWNKIGEALVARARKVLEAAYAKCELFGDKLRVGFFSERIKGLAVTLYNDGMIGCWTSFRDSPDEMICEATVGAWNDKRWKRKASLSLADIDIVVSVFKLAEILGPTNLEHAAFKLRLGRDSLAVSKDKKSSILLSYIPCHNSWSKKEMAEHLLGKAGIAEPPFHWKTYATRSWLCRSGRVFVLESGYPRRRSLEEPFPYRATAQLLANYIVDKIGSSGLPDYCYDPVSNRRVRADSAARPILALQALLLAGDLLEDPALRRAALSGLHYCCDHITNQHQIPRLELSEMTCGAAAEVFLVNALYQSRERTLLNMPAVRSLLFKLRGYFHSDGAITWQREGRRLESDHDLFPGSALRMAASIAELDGPQTLPPSLDQHLNWNRRRFGLLHSWGMVFWQTQGWAALHALTGANSMAAFVFELADWATSYQLEKNGAFLVDYAPDGPGFHTACVLEALANVWSVARRTGHSERERHYRESWERGVRFIDRLIIRDDDTFAMREPARAVGGVRQSLTSSVVRIDYVAHALLALVNGLSVSMVT